MKAPPVLQALIAAGLMSAIATIDRLPSHGLRIFAVLLCVIGVAIAVIGVWQFTHHKTTVNPMNLEKTSHLVTSGIYAFTRNPMYVGMVVVLIAWSLWLGSVWSLVIIPLFMVSMTLLQIKPEEQALTQIFGQQYLDYKNKVRRWL